MFQRAPNGFFVRNLIVFNLLRRGGYVAIHPSYFHDDVPMNTPLLASSATTCFIFSRSNGTVEQ